jgi:CRP/FNR family transcriptional regulator, nitrogen oxide reductase regulator
VNRDIDASARVVCSPNNVKNETLELVRRFPLFSEMSLEDCAIVVACAQLQTFQRGTTIFVEGDPIRQVVLLASGCAKLTQLGPQAQEVILRLIGPGETLCVPCPLKCSHCSTATTIERSAVLVWDAKQYEVATERFPVLGRNISCIILQALNQLEVRFREVSTEKVASRLSSQLLRLVSQVGKESDGRVEIALSQRDLAHLTGTTLFTVSRLLSQWKEQGIVSPRRAAVEILNIPALTEIAQEERSCAPAPCPAEESLL